MTCMFCSNAVPPVPLMTQINPSSSGNQRAGSLYSLTCIAYKTASGLTRPAHILWRGPNGAPLVNSDSIIVSGAISVLLRTSQMITFTSLSTIHAGNYSCQGTLPSPALTTDFQSLTSYIVTVSGKSTCIRLSVNLVCYLHFRFSSTSKSRNISEQWPVLQ